MSFVHKQSDSSDSDSDDGLDKKKIDALCFTADSYYYGIGNVAVNHKAAYMAYEKAASAGTSPYATVALARMILREEGGQTDLKFPSSPGFNKILAKSLLSKTIAQHEDMGAQFALGKILLLEGERGDDEVKVQEVSVSEWRSH